MTIVVPTNSIDALVDVTKHKQFKPQAKMFRKRDSKAADQFNYNLAGIDLCMKNGRYDEARDLVDQNYLLLYRTAPRNSNPEQTYSVLFSFMDLTLKPI